MEGYICPEVGVYDGGDNLSDHPHQPNASVSPPPLRDEDNSGPGKLFWHEDLPELQLCHTYKYILPGRVGVTTPCGLSYP